MIKIKDVYALPSNVRDLTDWCFREEWVPEVFNTFQISSELFEILSKENRLVVKTLINENYDGERIAEMHTLWFDEKPFAIVQAAGRSGCDHRARWITDQATYVALVGYLLKHLHDTNVFMPSDVVDPEAEVFEEELLSFYGKDFAKNLGIESEPRRRDVLLLANERSLVPGLPTDMYLVMLKVGAPDVADYIRRGSYVLKKHRLLTKEELLEKNPRVVEVNDSDGRDRVYLFEPCARPVNERIDSI